MHALPCASSVTYDGYLASEILFHYCDKVCIICVFMYFPGTSDKGTVEVTNCFTVPHNESEDEVRLSLISNGMFIVCVQKVFERYPFGYCCCY